MTGRYGIDFTPINDALRRATEGAGRSGGRMERGISIGT
jgi:hypothetical protein